MFTDFPSTVSSAYIHHTPQHVYRTQADKLIAYRRVSLHKTWIIIASVIRHPHIGRGVQKYPTTTTPALAKNRFGKTCESGAVENGRLRFYSLAYYPCMYAG